MITDEKGIEEMNMTRKWIMSTLMMFLLVSLITGCAGNGNNSGGAGNQEGPKAVDKVADEKRASISIVFGNTYKYPDNMDDNKNPYIDYIREETNLDIEVIVPPADGYIEKLNVIMASGDLPDMINATDSNWFVNYLNQKALKPLNDAIDKYGPDLKRLIPQSAWDSVTLDGQIYAIPSISNHQATELMWIRKDWLDNLGLPMPKTLEEYVNTARAFAEQDPDLNGANDTIGLIIGENLSNTAPFLGAFGVQRGQWVEQDGKLVYSSIMPEMKQALELLAQMYKDKIIDQEWALNKSKTVEEKVANGKAGMYSGPWHARRGAILTSQSNDPNAVWVEAEFPVGANGQAGVHADKLVRSYNVVPISSNNEEAVVKMLNFMIGEGFASLELGFENEVWTRVDGKVVTNFEEHNKHVYRNSIVRIVTPSDTTVHFEKLESLGVEFNLVNNIESIYKVLMDTEFTGMPTPSMSKNAPKLKKLEDEAFVKIVMGVANPNEFETFVEQWNKDGGAEMTEEVNKWYSQK